MFLETSLSHAQITVVMEITTTRQILMGVEEGLVAVDSWVLILGLRAAPANKPQEVPQGFVLFQFSPFCQ